MGRDFTGKVVLVTGAASGIGRQIAIEFAARGATLVLNDLREDELLAGLQRDLTASGTQAILAPADVSQAGEAEAMVHAAINAYGHLDILVNNAAYSVRKSFLDTTLDEASRTLAVTLWGPYLCSYYAAHAMVRSARGGSILMIGSIHGERPYPDAASYNMAKAGLAHLSASLALEFAPRAIRVNTIEPGWIDTPGERRHNTPQEIMERGKSLPFGRLGTTSEIAKAAAFLCSDDASYITGATLRVDGTFAAKF